MLTFESELPTQVNELSAMLREACSEPQWTWLTQARQRIANAISEAVDSAKGSASEKTTATAIKKASSALLITSANAKRQLGSIPVVVYGQSPTWHSHDIARLLLLQQFKNELLQLLQAQSLQTQWPQNLLQVYRRFGEDEKALLLRSLLLLGGEELLPIALDASRTNDEDLYATLALNNPFPGKHFPERYFHQLVLKSLFINLDINQIQGLKPRLSPTLSQLCVDLVEERKLAHRDIPHAIWHAIREEDLPQTNTTDPNTTVHNTTVHNTTGQQSL